MTTENCHVVYHIIVIYAQTQCFRDQPALLLAISLVRLQIACNNTLSTFLSFLVAVIHCSLCLPRRTKLPRYVTHTVIRAQTDDN
jgi:hypothetical protein